MRAREHEYTSERRERERVRQSSALFSTVALSSLSSRSPLERISALSLSLSAPQQTWWTACLCVSVLRRQTSCVRHTLTHTETWTSGRTHTRTHTQVHTSTHKLPVPSSHLPVSPSFSLASSLLPGARHTQARSSSSNRVMSHDGEKTRGRE